MKTNEIQAYAAVHLKKIAHVRNQVFSNIPWVGLLWIFFFTRNLTDLFFMLHLNSRSFPTIPHIVKNNMHQTIKSTDLVYTGIWWRRGVQDYKIRPVCRRSHIEQVLFVQRIFRVCVALRLHRFIVHDRFGTVSHRLTYQTVLKIN